MATYYVDPVNGNNANNGLGPDASHASNKPWLTIAKALGAAAAVAGDTVYLAPGTYRENNITPNASPASALNIVGDPTNAQGFKTSGGVSVTAGPVLMTAYATNDTTSPSANALFVLSGKNYFNFSNMIFVTGTSGGFTGAMGNNCNFTDCLFLQTASITLFTITATVDTNMNCTWNRCRFFMGTVANITLPTSASADYDAGYTFTNCEFYAVNRGVQVNASGANSFKGGGVRFYNCRLFGSANQFLQTNSANLTTDAAKACAVYGSFLYTNGGVAALGANTSGQIVEDYCHIIAATARSNVSAGANSHTNDYAPLFHAGQELLWGANLRPFGMPMAGSPMLGFGTPSGAPSVDVFNRSRPSGGGATTYAVGSMERHDAAAKETGTTDAGSVGLVLTGPGDQDLKIPVDASSTTISIKGRYDTNHAATNKPQVILLANPEIGVSGQTLTMSAAVDTWETLTFSAITPTAKGVVTLRLLSRSAAGNGKAFFDTVSIA